MSLCIWPLVNIIIIGIKILTSRVAKGKKTYTVFQKKHVAERRLGSHYLIFHLSVWTFNDFLVERKDVWEIRFVRETVKIWMLFSTSSWGYFMQNLTPPLLNSFFIPFFGIFDCLKFKLCTFCCVVALKTHRERDLWILFCSRIFHRKDDIHNRVTHLLFPRG